MAYAALTSLNQTMKRFLYIFYLLDLSPPQILDSACYEVQELQNFLRARKNSTSRDAFYGEIRDAARKLEYALEIHLSNQIRLYQSAKRVDHGDLIIDVQHSPTDLDGVVNQEIVSFTETMKKLRQLRDDEEDAAAAVSSSTNITPYFPGLMKSPNIVGLADVFKEIYNQLETEEHRNTTILLGMAGIGKTAIALKLFDEFRSNYEISAFVTVGPECKSKEIMLRALAQMNCVDIDKISKEPDDMVAKCLLTSLTHRRYLIVFDDLWSIDCFKEIKLVLPYNRNESQILVTTRLWEVARCYYYVQIRFLTEQESWDLLRGKVFGTKESCPFELEKAGRKIAEKCEGLPLTIITVAPLLSRVERTPEAWNKEAEKGSSIFAEAYDEMFEVLFLSYKYLDQDVKACFLYIGVFPEKIEIACSKLIKLWKVEGFFDPSSDFLPFEDYAWNCIRKIFQNSLVLGQGRRSCQATSKSCRLHSAYWHLCSREARNEKLFHIINSYAANNSFCIQDIIRSEQRLCIHNNTLLGFKEVYEYSVEPNTDSTVRSLLCTGPHHHYPVPIRLQCFRLLRVLNVLTVRFNEFPMEVVGLYLLRYLALTSNRELPASISKLWSLEYLIIHQHLSIKSPRVNSYLPMEIWCMEELEHLEVMGFDLPDPIYDGDAPSLPKLSTLLGVSPKSCTDGVLSRIPNLKKLGIQIELAPDADDYDVVNLSCLDHIYRRSRLIKSVKCVIVNPNPIPQPIAAFPTSLSKLYYVNKLTLSGLGYPWEKMKILGVFPKLEVLKLQCYAFQGPKWKTYESNDGSFNTLSYLLLEDTDLVHWEGHNCFRHLRRLTIRHCYKLKEIPFGYTSVDCLDKIKIVDCPLVVACARKLQEFHRKTKRHMTLRVSVKSTWDEGKPKS